MGRRRDSRHAVSVAVADAARDGCDRAQARRKRSARRGLSPHRRTRLPRAVPASSACSPSSPTKRSRRSCRSTPAWMRAFAPCSAIRPILTASAIPRHGPAIIEQARDRFIGRSRARARGRARRHRSRETTRAAREAGVGPRARRCDQQPAIVAVWPPEARCGLALVPSDRSRQACGIELSRAAVQPRSALDGAADRRRSHQASRAHALAARRVAVDRGAARSAIPVDAPACRRSRADGQACRSAARAVGAGCAVPDDRSCRRRPRCRTLARRIRDQPPAQRKAGRSDRVLLRAGCHRSTDRRRSSSGTTRSRAHASSACSTEIDDIGADVDAQPVRTLQRLARCGSLLGDDMLYGISDQLGELKPIGGPRGAPRAADAAGADAVSLGAAARSAWLARRAVRHRTSGDRRGRAGRRGGRRTPVRVRFACSSSRPPCPAMGRSSPAPGRSKGCTWRIASHGCSNACRASSIRRTTRSTSISRSRSRNSARCFDRASTTSCISPATAGTTPSIPIAAAGCSPTARSTRSSCGRRWPTRKCGRG